MKCTSHTHPRQGQNSKTHSQMFFDLDFRSYFEKNEIYRQSGTPQDTDQVCRLMTHFIEDTNCREYSQLVFLPRANKPRLREAVRPGHREEYLANQ